MTTATLKFNLVDAPWIPVTDMQGGAHLVSLREALVAAPQYRTLGGETPPVTVALYRLLLAITHRVGFGEQSPRSSRRAWADRLAEYLEDWHDRFELFDAATPFFQDPATPTYYAPGRAAKTLAALVPEQPSGANALIRGPRVLDSQRFYLPPAAAARRLLAAQTMFLGGLSGHPAPYKSFPAAPWATQVVFYVQGANLYETLLLNSLPQDVTDLPRGTPLWEREPQWEWEAFEREATGMSDYLSWPYRRILLVADERGVYGLYWFHGYELPALRNPYAWYRPRKVSRTEYRYEAYRFRHDAQTPAWSDFAALVASYHLALDGTAATGDAPPEVLPAPLTAQLWAQPPALLALGMVTNQSKYIGYQQHSFVCPLTAQATERLAVIAAELDALKSAVERATRLFFAEALVHAEQLQADPEAVKRQAAANHVAERFWPPLAVAFQQVLAQLDGAAEAYAAVRSAWVSAVLFALESVVQGWPGGSGSRAGVIAEDFLRRQAGAVLHLRPYQIYLEEQMTKAEQPYITYLEGLVIANRRGDLATLRRGVGQPAWAVLDMAPLVAPWVGEWAQLWDEEVTFRVAAWFATHPPELRPGGRACVRGLDLGDAVRRLIQQDDRSRVGVERLLQAALQAGTETELLGAVEQLIRRLQKAAVPVNWHSLYADLRAFWHPDRYIQRRWALRCWGSRPKTAAEAEAADETPAGEAPATETAVVPALAAPAAAVF